MHGTSWQWLRCKEVQRKAFAFSYASVLVSYVYVVWPKVTWKESISFERFLRSDGTAAMSVRNYLLIDVGGPRAQPIISSASCRQIGHRWVSNSLYWVRKNKPANQHSTVVSVSSFCLESNDGLWLVSWSHPFLSTAFVVFIEATYSKLVAFLLFLLVRESPLLLPLLLSTSTDLEPRLWLSMWTEDIHFSRNQPHLHC